MPDRIKITILENNGNYIAIANGKLIQSWYMPSEPNKTIYNWLKRHASYYEIKES